MSGNMIASSSNDDWVTALGSYNATDQTITGLIGRGEGCTQEASATRRPLRHPTTAYLHHAHA